MKLYYSPGACSLSPHIVAHEAGLSLEPVRVDFKTRTTADGQKFDAINPRGYVPALELEDGSLMTEGAVIVQYLADLAPQKGLLPPAGTRERYRVQEWLNFVATELHKQFSPLFYADTPDATKETQRKKLARRFKELDVRLADSPYIAADHFTVADAYAFTILRWAEGLKIDLAAYPNLRVWQKKIAARPKVVEALNAEGLMKQAA